MSAAIARVGIVGGGQMGAGIAEVCARAGLDTIVCEADATAADRARERVAVSLERAVRRGKLDRLSAEDALGRLVFTGSLDDLADRQLVIEAVVENAAAKTEISTALDKIVEDPGAILATNTSAIPVMRLGMATHRADRVLGLHFFNPVPVLPLVEVVTSLHTSAGTLAAAEEFAASVLGKTVVRSQDRAGFVVNRRRRGHRDGTGLRPPDGTAQARRPDRPGHGGLHRGVAVRRVQGTALRPAAAAPADGGGGTARPEGRARVPPIRPGLRGPGCGSRLRGRDH